MIVVGVIGGLGNQMFQYATAKILEKKFNTTVKLDIRPLYHYNLCFGSNKGIIPRKYELENFDINLVRATLKDLELVCGGDKFKAGNFFYEPEFLNNVTDGSYYTGYWQSHLYFDSDDALKLELQKQLVFRSALDDANQKMKELILSAKNPVGIHLRRTDNVYSRGFGVCPEYYYDFALQYMQERIEDMSIFIFSDDTAFANNFMRQKKINGVVVDINDIDSPANDIELMRSCKHFITANSTFSWWGAYLIQNKGKIVTAWGQHFEKDRYGKYSNEKTTFSPGEFFPESWVKF